MKQPQRIFSMIAVGLLVIVTAYGLRQRVLTARRARAPLAQPADPRLQTLQAQAGKLLNAVRADPKARAPRLALADFYQDQRLFDLALEQRILLANMNPDSPDDRTRVATTLIAARHYPEAEGVYRFITARWPQAAAGWQGLSTALYHQKRYYEAWQSGQKALRLEPSDLNNHLVVAVSALSYALQYSDHKAYAAVLLMARRELEYLTQHASDNGSVYYQLGLACEAQRDQKAMTAYLKQAVVLLPQRADVAVALARAYNMGSDKAMARKTLEDALKRHAEDAVVHDMLGQALQSSGEPDSEARALEEFRQAALQKPNNAYFLEHFATACVRGGKLKEAKIIFENVTRLKPYRPFAYQQLAAIYTRLGDARSATEAAKISTQMYSDENQMKQIQQLSAMHPGNVTLRLALADRYREIGQRGAARDEYLGILQVDKGNKRAQEALSALAKATSGEGKAVEGESAAAPALP